MSGKNFKAKPLVVYPVGVTKDLKNFFTILLFITCSDSA